MTITVINVRNQFRGKVRKITEGPVVGKNVVALVKSTDVSIATL